MFSRKSPETEDRAMSALPDDLGIPMKPARPTGQQASVAPLSRNPAPVPPRTPEGARQGGDTARPSEAPRRPPEAAGAPPLAAGRGPPRRQNQVRPPNLRAAKLPCGAGQTSP